MLEQSEIISILTGQTSKNDRTKMDFAESLEIGVPINLYWDQLFNTHIGIFGNTGSGKSNTLAKLYTSLFDSAVNISGKSKFLFLDFNGEYTGNKSLSSKKETIILNTKKAGDKIQISSEMLLNTEILAILFSATEKTQTPFLESTLKRFFTDELNTVLPGERLKDHIVHGFREMLEANNNSYTLGVFNDILRLIGLTDIYKNWIVEKLSDVLNATWHTRPNGSSYYHSHDGEKNKCYWDNPGTKKRFDEYCELLGTGLNGIELASMGICDQLLVASKLNLITGLSRNYVQFDHINPLLARIEKRKSLMDNLFEINNSVTMDDITVVSMRNCNLDAKKTVPLILAKQLYTLHKEQNDGNKTFHLIIDEAHNILSSQSTRESETWKDYRLEVFEEIIKEGRKFGFFLTLASQRPHDISPTIISQLHNFFVHRLVSERDLQMVASALSDLNKTNFQKLPNLGPGECVIAGTSFKNPVLVKVNYLGDRAPKSETVNLEELWIDSDDCSADNSSDEKIAVDDEDIPF